MIFCCLTCRVVVVDGEEIRQAEVIIGPLRVAGVIHVKCLQGAAREDR